MKNGKKITAVAAASAVVSAMVAPAAMAATTNFSDISGNFAADAINALAAKGIITGFPDGTFQPNGNITREQFAVVLAKALNLDASGTDSFTDVDSWAAGYVAAVNKEGLVAGYDATHFGGKDLLTREQMATILVRALTKEQGYDATGKASNLTFSDSASISSYAKDSVGAAVELGLIHGMPDGTFAPQANATRAQVALVTQSFLNVQINALSVTASATLNDDNTATVTGTAKGADSVKVSVDGGDAVAATLNTDGTYTFNTNVLASGSHTISVVAYNGTTASQPASATVTVGTVGVASVKATDAKDIQVVFNTPMDTTQVDGSVYTITSGSPNYAAPTVTGVTWSADGKTATLALSDALVNNVYYTVTVPQGLQDANGNVLSTTADYNTGFLWDDTTAPTVTAVKNALGGAVEIDFSKPLSGDYPPVVVLNGSTIDLTANNLFADGDTSITIPASIVQGYANVGDTINVIVSGAEDQANTDGVNTHNVMSLYQGTLTYSMTATTPVVQSLKASAENQMTLTFNEPITGNINDSSATVATDGTTDDSTAIGLQVVDSTGVLVPNVTATTTDGQTFTITVPQGQLFQNGVSTENLTVTVAGFEDSGLDVGNSTTQAVTLTQDTSAPTLINTQYDTTNSNIIFTFDKDIAAGTLTEPGNIEAVDNTTGIAYDLSSAAQIGTNEKSVVINNTSNSVLPAGSYTINFAAGAITDQASVPNDNAAFSQVVTVPSTTSTDGPTVTAAAVTTPGTDTIEVDYSDAVKGGTQAGSATALSSYKLNGAALPAGTTITLNSGVNDNSVAQTKATIVLPSGSVASTATEVLTVSGVQTLDGVSVATYNNTVDLTDNTAPTLTAAKVNANGQLVLTFSEDLDGMGDEASSNITQPGAGEFIVTVNGVQINVNNIAVSNGSAENQIILTATGASFASGTVVVKTNDTVAHDAANNVLVSGTSVTATH